MSWRTRLIFYLNGLLLVTISLIAGVAMFTSAKNLQERARQDALGTASLLVNAARMAIPALPPLEEPAGGWPSPAAREAAVTARKRIERDAWREAIRRLAENPTEAGNFEAIFVAEEHAQLLAWSTPYADEDLVSQYWHGMDRVVRETVAYRTPIARCEGDFLVATVPLERDLGGAWVFLCKFDTAQLHAAIAATLRHIVLLSLGGLVAGAAVSSVLAKRICRPVRQLAEAAQVIGSGEFDHRVRVESKDEFGVLAESFNHMAESLQASMQQLASAAAEKETRRREMEIAWSIQQSLMPESCPQLQNFDVAAESAPAEEVGGDFYDFIPLPDGRWGVVIADVSGKGVPAALVMSLSRCLIRAYSQDKPSVLDALQLANSFMLRDVRSDMFVTCFYAVIDPSRETVTYVNAGHNPPLVTRSEGEVLMLQASGTPLGILAEDDMTEEVCRLGPGDVALMYTDGITEAASAYGEQFGVSRLRSVVRNVRQRPASEVAQRVLTAVRAFAGDQPQFDDMTLVVLKAQQPSAERPAAAADLEPAVEASAPA